VRAQGRVAVPLAGGFLIAAMTFFALAWLVGRTLPVGWAWPVIVPVALALCAASDLAFPRFPLPMARRQTPQRLVGRFHPALGGFIWGLDTGSVVSTFRASGASWAGVVLVLAGWGPWWSGLAYALAFCLPLTAVVLAAHADVAPTAGQKAVRARRRFRLPDGAGVSTYLLRLARQARLGSGIALAAATALAIFVVVVRL
jgi:hypothetical protein